MPMGVARRDGEDRGNRQKICAGMGERPIKMRKAHIVANTHAEPAPLCFGDNGAAAGPVGVALAVALAARQIKSETTRRLGSGSGPAVNWTQATVKSAVISSLPAWRRVGRRGRARRVRRNRRYVRR